MISDYQLLITTSLIGYYLRENGTNFYNQTISDNILYII